MDTVLEALLSWQFLFFCLAIGAIVFVIRILVEYGMENWWPLKQWQAANKESKLWRSLILPILPVILGVVAAYFAVMYPYPEGIHADSISGRLVFGLVSGFTSGLIVRLYTAFLSSKVSEFRDKINTILNERTVVREEAAAKAEEVTKVIAVAKEQVSEEKSIADKVLGDAKVAADEQLVTDKTIADNKLFDAKIIAVDKLYVAKVIADDKLNIAKEVAADKKSKADHQQLSEEDLGILVRNTINKDQ